MERLHFPDGHQKQEALNHERLYTPPHGIRSEHFHSIRYSDFLINRNGYKGKDPNCMVLGQCIEAVKETSRVIMQKGKENNALFLTYFTKEENESVISRFVSGALYAMTECVDKDHSLAVVAHPIGGLAPLHAIMKEVAKYPQITEKVDFIPLKNISYVAKKDRYIIIDDGFGTGTTQAGLLPLIGENPQEINQIVEGIKILTKKGVNCNDERFIPFYSALIERFAYHNAIILPLFTKNSLFMELLYNYSDPKMDEWGHVQKTLIGEKIMTHIPEDRIMVGAMVDEIPCRDIGIHLQTLSEHGYIKDKEILTSLEGEGLAHAEFRLMADRPELLAFSEKSKGKVFEIFVKNLYDIL